MSWFWMTGFARIYVLQYLCLSCGLAALLGMRVSGRRVVILFTVHNWTYKQWNEMQNLSNHQQVLDVSVTGALQTNLPFFLRLN